jgi:hypothetical protein
LQERSHRLLESQRDQAKDERVAVRIAVGAWSERDNGGRKSDLDRFPFFTEIVIMNTATSSEALADLEALCGNVGKPLDPDLVKRVQERARAVRERVYREKRLLDVAVDLIRETRDE